MADAINNHNNQIYAEFSISSPQLTTSFLLNESQKYIGGTGIKINRNIISVNFEEVATAAQGTLASTALQPNDNISQLTNNVGYITEITSSDVISALGFIPYNSTNPNGYQANVIETIQVNGVSQTVVNKTIDISVPSEITENTVEGWGFTKNTGTVTSVNNITPINGNVSLSIPTVPTNISAFNNDSGYITNASITNMQTTTNLVTSVSSQSTDSQYPSAKLFYDTCGNIETLINAL